MRKSDRFYQLLRSAPLGAACARFRKLASDDAFTSLYARVSTHESLRTSLYARVSTHGSLRTGLYARVSTHGSLRMEGIEIVTPEQAAKLEKRRLARRLPPKSKFTSAAKRK
jgi:hypothetical protein